MFGLWTILGGKCEGGTVYQLPVSQDTFCFLKAADGMVSFDEGKAQCQNGGYDGHLELRYEEDATFMAKLLYCGWDYIKNFQPGE